MSKKFTYVVTSTVLWALPLMATEYDAAASNAPQEHFVGEIATPIAHSPALHPFTGKVAGSKVRLRTHPKLDGHVIRETGSGEHFAVTGLENDFYAVQPPKGTKGYVFRTYILDGVVEAERVNVRLSPEMDAPVVGRLRAGDKVNAKVSDTNNKWFEIDLPENSRFYIAKEYVENVGPIDLLAKMEERRSEASRILNSVFLHSRSEIQKPFEEVDLDTLHQKFQKVINDYAEFPDIVEKARDALHLFEETYIQKKIAFLESKADRTTAAKDATTTHLQKLAQMGKEFSTTTSSESTSSAGKISDAATSTIGLSLAKEEGTLTDKMLVWQPLEESLYQLWAATHEGHAIDEFYKEESLNATQLTGIVEAYNRPVKNRPGDFLLRCENLPVAFLYSTKINLQEMVGKNVTLIGAPRPNNNFAFPSYFVLSVE